MKQLLLITRENSSSQAVTWLREFAARQANIELHQIDSTIPPPQSHFDAIFITPDSLTHELLQKLQHHHAQTPVLTLGDQEDGRIWQISQNFCHSQANHFNNTLTRLLEQTSYRELFAESQTQLYNIFACLTEAVVVFDNDQLCFVNTPAQNLMNNIKPKLADLLRLHRHGEFRQKIILPGHDGQHHVIKAKFFATQWRQRPATLAILQNITHDQTENKQLHVQLQEHIENHTRTRQELTTSRNRLELIMKSANEGYWDWFVPEGEVFFSPRWKAMLGYAEHDIEPTFNTWINLIHTDDLGLFLLTWTQYMDGHQSRFNIEYRALCKDGSYLWVEASSIKEADDNDHLLRLAGTQRDISQRKQTELKLLQHRDNLEQLIAERTRELEAANDKLQLLARLDSLTELTNRRGFDENLRHALNRSQRESSPLCLIMVDIDYFKHYNDHYGHPAGDICIKQVARALAHSVHRPSDIAARYGGEEFAMLLPATDYNGAVCVANTIADNIAKLSLQCNPFTQRPVSLSMGIACNTASQALKPAELIELADRALYHAKHQGRNQVFYYDENNVLKQA